MIVLDASFTYALLDDKDWGHDAARSWYGQSFEDLVTTPLALAEVDHLAATRLGRSARAAFLADVAEGVYEVMWWDAAGAEAAHVAERYADLGPSLTDGSLVALAAHVGTTSVATFDERHFRAMKPLTGEPSFTLLPLDA